MKMRSYSNIPEEIMLDTFILLPTKSIGRCRCVSKPWRDLLSRPEFIRAHLNRSKNLREETLILNVAGRFSSLFTASLRNAHHLFDKITIPTTRLSFARHPDTWGWVHGSCDGLLLVGDNESKILVLNPVTRVIREVPPLPFAHDSFPDPRHIIYGFGYDSASHDYKIVTLSYYEFSDDYSLLDHPDDHEADGECTETFANVYSLKTGTWKRAECLYDYHFENVMCGLFIDDHIHWLTDCNTIWAFDLAKEKLHKVPPPSSCCNIGDMCLAVLGGYLCLTDDFENIAWVMKEYGVRESWTKLMLDRPEEVGLLGQEEMLLLKESRCMCLHNFKQGTSKDVEVDETEDETGCGLDAQASFVESLVSPYGTNESRQE